MIKRITAAFLLLFISFALVCCAQVSEGKKDGISIVTTVFPQYDFAKRLTEGTGANVKMLIPAGSEAHSYDPTPADMIAAAECDIFIWVGGESEAWADKIIKSTVKEKTKVIALMDTVPLLESDGDHDHGDGHDYDEHVWTSPKNAMAMVEVLLATLCETDPDNAEAYRSNSEKYLASLEVLDRDFAALAEKIGKRPIIVGDRFPFLYLASSYGFVFASPFRGCSAHTEASVAEITSVIEIARENGAKTVFSVDFSNEKMAKSIADEVGASVSRLYSCHTASGADIDAGNGYIEIMRKNLDALMSAYE